jgi:hypothetical protein
MSSSLYNIGMHDTGILLDMCVARETIWDALSMDLLHLSSISCLSIAELYCHSRVKKNAPEVGP